MNGNVRVTRQHLLSSIKFSEGCVFVLICSISGASVSKSLPKVGQWLPFMVKPKKCLLFFVCLKILIYILDKGKCKKTLS